MSMSLLTKTASIHEKKQMIRVYLMCTIFIMLMLLTLGGCSKNDEQFVEKCTPGDSIHSGEFVLVNRDYGSSRPKYAHCIFENRGEGTFGWTWEEVTPPPIHQYDTGISAYVFYGATSTFGTPPPLVGIDSTTPALPVKAEELASLTIDYHVSVATTSQYRLAFKTRLYGCGGVAICSGDYLDIALYSDRLPPSPAVFQQRVTIDGAEYDFYDGDDVYGSYHWFVLVRPEYAGPAYSGSFAGTLRFHKFLEFLAEKGRGLDDIEHVKFSQRFWGGGSGRTDIRTFSVNVTPREE